jgi:Spy/CpxP family protein refolding chaperone
MTMRKWVLSIVVVALVAGAGWASADIRARLVEQDIVVEPFDAEGEVPDQPRRAAIARFLQLTEEQVATWDELLAAREEAVKPLREELRSIEEQLRELLQGENPDPTAVGTLVLAGKTLREGIAAAHKTYLEGFEAMLSPEQKGRLGAIRRAAHLAPLVPAFAAFGLIPPPPQPAR